MKSLFLVIFGAILGWGITGFFTKGFETDYLFILIIGIVIGHSIGRRKDKEEFTESM
ncbi:tRNA U-34 5-methylaminomethyl-2-thiouridine biosynthesis protein [Rossellomorea vietnamensis]|uniref:tRNA U-34 5-methylaminomethyl-2-thiouridine biosynthesis protein n=1 Tax=Rossellomorea vietnamensis TaxID=218284 RepID=UPI001CCCC89B|nr:tRNA U-34 5-methylaminomethyl-2-thiouridine biosynthesis protein [Rossellomorea vietnamensis]MCA0148261.1 tRNA U-34 5-methylaminomethyl-2-thiouridine biosynthesis protein [Rossellomorea vietnamensis]